MTTHDTLGDALPREILRVQDEVLPEYVELGPAGAIGAAFLRADIHTALRAIAAGDTVQMIRSLESLRGAE